MAKYGVDMVVGNLLGNKQWVRIGYNQKRFDKKEYKEHHENI
jgi:hypothetical protein